MPKWRVRVGTVVLDPLTKLATQAAFVHCRGKFVLAGREPFAEGPSLEHQPDKQKLQNRLQLQKRSKQ